MKVIIIMLGCLSLIGLGGCSEADRQRAEEAVNRSAEILAQVQGRLDQAESLIPALQEQITAYRGMAEEVGGERVAGLIDAAEHRLAQVQDVVPQLRAAVDNAQQGVAAAEQAMAMADRGARWWEYASLAAGVIGSLFGGAGVRAASRGKRALKSAAGLADELRPLAEQYDAGQARDAVSRARRQQHDAGVRDLVERARIR